MTSEDIKIFNQSFRSLYEVMCGFESRTPLVRCNVEEEEEDDDYDYDNEVVARQGGGVIDVLNGGDECEGTLKVS